MAKKLTPSQYKSKIRQEIAKYNRAVDSYNRNLKSAINKYNQAVRAYNANVQRNRRDIINLLKRLQSTPQSKTVTISYRTTAINMHNSYERVVQYSDHAEGLSPYEEHIFDLIDQEHQNNLNTATMLLENSEPIIFSETDENVGRLLIQFSDDLYARWQGAIFALNPQNPDATRHFCTSAREIFTESIEKFAPDANVLASKPDCALTPNGNPTRREKITYLIAKKGLSMEVGDFVEDDISNILELFRVLSDGTHGAAGKYSMSQLQMVKKRVEDGIGFLYKIAA